MVHFGRSIWAVIFNGQLGRSFWTVHLRDHRFLIQGKEKMEEELKNKPKPSARNQSGFQNDFQRSLNDWLVF